MQVIRDCAHLTLNHPIEAECPLLGCSLSGYGLIPLLIPFRVWEISWIQNCIKTQIDLVKKLVGRFASSCRRQTRGTQRDKVRRRALNHRKSVEVSAEV